MCVCRQRAQVPGGVRCTHVLASPSAHAWGAACVSGCARRAERACRRPCVLLLLPRLGPSAPWELCIPCSIVCDSQTVSKKMKVSCSGLRMRRDGSWGGRSRRHTPRIYGEDVVIAGIWLPEWVARRKLCTRWCGEPEGQSGTSPLPSWGHGGQWESLGQPRRPRPPSFFNCKTEAGTRVWVKGTL